MHVIRVFQVVTNSDLTEGRGHTVYLDCFETKAAAEDFARDKGVMGTPASVRPRDALVVSDGQIRLLEDAQLLFRSSEEQEREKALKKLTPRERALLGVE